MGVIQTRLTTIDMEENKIEIYRSADGKVELYDFQSLNIEQTTKGEPFRATYGNAMKAIEALKEKFGASKWFANEKDDSFKSKKVKRKIIVTYLMT